VDVGSEVTGSGVPADVESVGLLVEDGAAAESVGLFGGAGAVGGGWAVVWWLVDGALVVCPCWLHPYSNNPTSKLAAAIWTSCIDFAVIIPLL
jgi:hypothetical protein